MIGGPSLATSATLLVASALYALALPRRGPFRLRAPRRAQAVAESMA